MFRRRGICAIHILIEQIADEIAVLFQDFGSEFSVFHTHPAQRSVREAGHFHVGKGAQFHLIADGRFMRHNAKGEDGVRAVKDEGFHIAAVVGERQVHHASVDEVRSVVDGAGNSEQFALFDLSAGEAVTAFLVRKIANVCAQVDLGGGADRHAYLLFRGGIL